MASAASKVKRGPLGEARKDCPVCQSLHLEYEFVVEKSPVCSCQDCGLLFLNPQPGEGMKAERVAPLDSPLLSEIYRANAVERLASIVAYANTPQGNLLMIGADEHLSLEARKMGFKVQTHTAEEFEASGPIHSPEPFLACVLFCALERMRDPMTCLKRIRKLLVENGALMVISPTTDSKAARLLRSSWWEFNPGNLFYFSTDTLQSLLIRTGFGDPIISADRSLVSLNYLRQRIAAHPRTMQRYRWLRRAMSLSPVLRNKAFRVLYGRTRILVRSRSTSTEPVLSVIVPVYNESTTVVELVDGLLAKRLDGVEIEVIIVESNSTDGSRDLVSRYREHPRVRLLLQERAAGKGNAVRAGLTIASGAIVLFQDADLEYDLNDYDSLITPLLRYQSNFVLGSRHGGQNSSWKVRQFTDSPGLTEFFNFGHLLFLTLFNWIYRQRLNDPFTMFKVFRRECLYGLVFESDRFDFDFEIVIKFLRKGYKPRELPVNYRSRSIKEGKKVTIIRDPLTWLWALVKFRKSPLYSFERRS